MSNLELVCAGFSATLGIKVVPVKDGGGFSIDDLFSQTFVMKPPVLPLSVSPSPSLLDVFVSDGSSTFPFRVKGNHSIHKLKTQIGGKHGITVDSIKLLCGGKELQDCQTIAHNGIQLDDTIHCLIGADNSFSYKFNISDLDPKFDYDVTEITDDGERYERGGFPYERPYGWNRIAIKVLGKYSDDV